MSVLGTTLGQWKLIINLSEGTVFGLYSHVCDDPMMFYSSKHAQQKFMFYTTLLFSDFFYRVVNIKWNIAQSEYNKYVFNEIEQEKSQNILEKHNP